MAHFQFLSAEESYAALVEQPENIGVISFDIYSEYDPIWMNVFRGSDRTLFYGDQRSNDTTLGHDVGTGFGRLTEHEVNSTSFLRDKLVAKFVLEYTSQASLMEAGIIKPSTPVASVDEIETEKALAVLNSMWVKIPESEREQKNQELRELLIRWQAEDINERYKDSP